MNNISHQYIVCSICKNLVFHKHLQIHYKQCKEKQEEQKIREEILKQTHPYYIYLENQRRNEELKKMIPVLNQQNIKNNQVIYHNNQQINQNQINLNPYQEDKNRKDQNDKKTETKNLKEENKKVVENMINHIFSVPTENKKEKEKEKEKENHKIKEEKLVEETKNKEILTVENYKPPNFSISTSYMTEQLMNHFFNLYDKLFYDYVKDKSIALVGPAESVLNTNRGHIIDKFDLTVRLNKSIPLPSNLAKDIGTKTHILYNSLNTTDFPGENKLSPTLHKKYGIQFVCSSYPFNHSVFQEDIARYVRKYKFELPFKVMDDNKFKKFEMALGTRPYTGTCAIMDLLSYPIKILYITGLDFYYSKYYSQYREISKGQLKHTRNSNIHNAKPQLNYLRHISLLDDRIVLDGFLNKILFEDYEKVYRNLRNIKLNYIYGFQNDSIKEYMENRDFYISYTKYQNMEIPNDKKDKNNIILTNNSWFVANEQQYIFIITQSINELKKVILEKKNHPNKYFGNFYYTIQSEQNQGRQIQQGYREVPSIYLQTKYLIDIKNILLRLNIKNATLTLILFLSIGIYFPDNHYFYENEFLSYFTNMDEKKLIKYLIRRKFFKIIKNQNN